LNLAVSDQSEDLDAPLVDIEIEAEGTRAKTTVTGAILEPEMHMEERVNAVREDFQEAKAAYLTLVEGTEAAKSYISQAQQENQKLMKQDEGSRSLAEVEEELNTLSNISDENERRKARDEVARMTKKSESDE
jgi:hypothetical protein